MITISATIMFNPEDESFDKYDTEDSAGDLLSGAIARAFPLIRSDEYGVEVTSISFSEPPAPCTAPARLPIVPKLQLESFVDAHSLAVVLEMLHEISCEKSRARGHDVEPLIRRWERYAGAFDRLAVLVRRDGAI